MYCQFNEGIICTFCNWYKCTQQIHSHTTVLKNQHFHKKLFIHTIVCEIALNDLWRSSNWEQCTEINKVYDNKTEEIMAQAC